MVNLKKFFVIGFVLFFSTFLFASDGWHLTSYIGASHTLDSRLKFHLEDQTDIVKDADWESKSFEDSLYYSVRFEKWKSGKAWGIDWTHHKIYLKNTDAQVENFSISDGYNMLTLNRAIQCRNFIKRAGFGIIMGHPDVTLGGGTRFWNQGGIGGSYLSGIVAMGSLEKRVYETDHHFVSLDGKLTTSWARVPISTNNAEYADTGLNIAFHVTLGLGSKPFEKRSVKNTAQYISVPFLVQSIAWDLI